MSKWQHQDSHLVLSDYSIYEICHWDELSWLRMGNPAVLIQQRLSPCTFFQPECIKLKETSPPACKHVPGLGAQDDTRQASQVRSINYYPLRFISLWNLHWITRQAPIPGCQDLYDVSILGSHNPPPWTLGSYQSSFSPQMYTIHLLEKCVGPFPWNLFASINSFMLLGSCREAFPRPD